MRKLSIPYSQITKRAAFRKASFIHSLHNKTHAIMNKYIFALLLSFVVVTCFGQENPCPPSGSTSVGLLPPTNQTLTPPNNPKNPRGTPPLSNDRLVFWIHGLGGNTDSWAKVAQATQYQSPGQSVPGYPHRKITSIPLTYSQFSLNGAASTLHNTLVSTGDALCTANGITDKTINFIIAHSQGGIVSRATDKMYDDLGMESDRRFGGVVTFGTPHGGARILNNKDQFMPFADEACKALIAGPALEGIQGNPAVDFFVPNEVFESISNKLCNFLANDIAPITFKDQFQEITEDYKVGAAAIGELNGHNSSLPRVALYGEETEPVFYRTMYHLKVKTPNQFPVFGADEDQPLVDRFNQLLNKYQANYELNRARVEYLEGAGFPCTPFQWWCCFPVCSIWDTEYWQKKDRRDAWREGYNWLNNSNNKYKGIIGAHTTTWVNTYQCACNGYTFPTNQPSCPPGCTLSSAGGYWSVISKPSDGVALAESAMAYPGAQTENLPGSNHQQMRNDSNTKAKMLKLLGGGFGHYFTTEVRQ
jgi:Predicted acetyltransferases and hydrolases with the alpha/beta hydrolase fold